MVTKIAEEVIQSISSAKTTLATDQQASSFADLLKGAASSVVENQQVAEQLSVQSVVAPETVDMQELITAISQAELSLQTMVAVRDKAVEAYTKIIDLPI